MGSGPSELAPQRRLRHIGRVATQRRNNRVDRSRHRRALWSCICLGAVIVAATALGDETGAIATASPAAQAIADKMRSIETLQVRMRQEKELQVLAETVKTEGTLTFARPRRLAIDLKGEAGATLIIDGDTMITVYKTLKRTERTSLSKDPRARAVAEHLFLLLEAEPKALAAVYDVTVLEEKPLTIRLVPRSDALAGILARVEARFDGRGFVDRLILFEKNGDLTRWEFDTPRINEPVPNSAFEPTS